MEAFCLSFGFKLTFGWCMSRITTDKMIVAFILIIIFILNYMCGIQQSKATNWPSKRNPNGCHSVALSLSLFCRFSKKNWSLSHIPYQLEAIMSYFFILNLHVSLKMYASIRHFILSPVLSNSWRVLIRIYTPRSKNKSLRLFLLSS